ncbi:hypothetical protein B4079_1855 [Bacillus cereus]|nr:hypothetical protein B4079_1855 [Bacillus cereus]
MNTYERLALAINEKIVRSFCIVTDAISGFMVVGEFFRL